MRVPALLRLKPLRAASWIFVALLAVGVEQPAMRIEPTTSVGPRTMEDQTATAVVRDYQQAWQSLSQALEQNRADLLDADFVGVAKEKLTDTIREQQKLGIQTSYQDRSHDIRLLLYSPEGLSIQLLDTAEYDLQIIDHGKIQSTQHLRSRYIAVLSPTEVRWKVRIFQAAPE